MLHPNLTQVNFTCTIAIGKKPRRIGQHLEDSEFSHILNIFLNQSIKSQ